MHTVARRRYYKTVIAYKEHDAENVYYLLSIERVHRGSARMTPRDRRAANDCMRNQNAACRLR
jgi:hypothetical protein